MTLLLRVGSHPKAESLAERLLILIGVVSVILVCTLRVMGLA